MTRRTSPCDDPFCGGPDRGCGWSPAEHLRPNQGGKDTFPANVTPPAPTMAQVAAPAEYVAALATANPGSVRAMYGEPAATLGQVITAEAKAADLIPATPPPSTVETMRDVLDSLDATRPRSMQVNLGPSELGVPCDRQIAMKLAGIPRQPADKRPPWAPMQGTAMHALMEEALRHHNAQLGRERWIVEQELEISIDYDRAIIGHGDAYDQDHDMVVDWKYTGSTALKAVSRKTVANELLVSPQYRVQAHLYGYGHWRAGRDVKWVRLVFLARSHDYDASREWTERYDPQIAVDAINRYFAISDLVRKLPLADQPALWALTKAHPDEHDCAWCPFRRPGPVDGTGCPGNTEQKIAKQMAGLIAA